MSKKRSASSVHSHSIKTPRELDHEMLKNLVELQKVHINLAEKFDHLSKEISQLLALFELTARNFAKNVPQTTDYQKDKDFLDKIDRLLDQNKVLAKGLSIMEDQIRERVYSPQPQHAPNMSEKKSEESQFQPSMASKSRPLPRF